MDSLLCRCAIIKGISLEWGVPSTRDRKASGAYGGSAGVEVFPIRVCFSYHPDKTLGPQSMVCADYLSRENDSRRQSLLCFLVLPLSFIRRK